MLDFAPKDGMEKLTSKSLQPLPWVKVFRSEQLNHLGSGRWPITSPILFTP